MTKIKSRMTKEEFRRCLNLTGLTVSDLCTAIYFETGSTITPNRIHQVFARNELASSTLTACLRIFFISKGVNYDRNSEIQ
ncbi:MAG: hypothetical protein OXR68_00135 [Alphaproteobacteria bacterium]|nr:hypothetical protein [Alphaproteobacteria bacterium]MDD9919019.1 hypothetical protein [Alphaproteobacteria bacterium]